MSGGNYGPGYTVNDLVYWIGFIGATACSYLAFQAMELERIWCLILSIVCGVAAGFGFELLYRQFKTPRRPPDGDQ